MAKTAYLVVGILIGIIGIVIFLNRPTSISTPTEPSTPAPTTSAPTTTTAPTTSAPTTTTAPTTSAPTATTAPTTSAPTATTASTTPSPVKMKVMEYITQLDNATSLLTKSAAKINNAYGVKNGFYIAGQAVPPSTGITKIGADVIKATTADCTLNVPSGATLFIYNPITMTCSYYSGNVSLSSLQIEPVGANSRNRTVGSVLL